jgi:outer membrane protein TolC
VIYRKARLEDALAGYSDRYLSALFEVETALLEERKNAEQLMLVEKQLVTAQRLLTEARNRFSQGLTDYLPVITSLSIVQNLERTVVNTRRRVLSSRVGLHRALGGPMLNPETPIVLCWCR